ncbi:MAG: ATP-binding cassette domain-containing protein [SAR324 cluster bacterium]|nr:ATP-binding cassette domain-containing protein [SAR324 cluster bacterium]MCZ6843210.1 ATP-binding cassette domain-containing protein [SAR324 cluster bacterium]
MIEFTDLTKSYAGRLPVLDSVTMKIDQGEFFFLSGVSGAGKTTVFRLLLMLELPEQGNIRFNGADILRYSPAQRARHRRGIGTVFQDQDNRLLANESIEENVALPLRIAGLSGRKMRQRMGTLLEQVGLAERRKELVSGLSGGEKQLVSIARALVFGPRVFFADEPTGNLDRSMAFKVMELLRRIHDSGSTVIVATHDLNLIRSFRSRTLLIKDRKIQEVRLINRAETAAAR